ncbi:Glucan 1,3-beta-glucosidase [Drechslerella dactyloides]|uniref:Glucan 1,3-beta-glucosidase n=1 Tax=Drechslerella dactyloides TaxID=74499 RepID=A0AAD6J094_DREDA|nr:Glucan 1,3-beta-glucosidase [Drechslerella dactyloides]
MTGRARLVGRLTGLFQHAVKNSRPFHASRDLQSTAGKGHSLLRGSRPRRSFFYVPAHKTSYIKKALGSNADCIVLDLEDGVAESEKETARQNIRDLLQRLSHEGYHKGENHAAELCVRINHEGWIEADAWGDLKSPQAPSTALDKDLDLLTNSPDDISNVNNVVSGKRLVNHGDSSASDNQPVIALFETPRAIMNVGDFMKSKSPMVAIVFAAEDYAASTGIPRMEGLMNMLFARSAVVNLCKALGIPPIDMVCQAIRDTTVLERECLNALEMGFEGKQVVHPDQIEIVNRNFSPAKDDLDYSVRVLVARKQQQRAGAIEFEGKMVDMPVFRKAEDISFETGPRGSDYTIARGSLKHSVARMRHAFKEITDGIKQRANERLHNSPGSGGQSSARRPFQAYFAANGDLLAQAQERDVLAYRYHHGTNLGAIFVAERWLFGNLFADGATGDSELDAVKSQVSKHGVDTARTNFEAFWATVMTTQDWEYLANTANVTTVRLPIGYFTLGADFCRNTPFERYAAVYANAWTFVKQFVTTAASYGIGTLIDLHALPGGANGDSHSGTSSGKAELWNSARNLNLALECAKFIARETSSMPSVVGLQLVNEAIWQAPGMYQFYDSVIDALHPINPRLVVYISDAWDVSTALRYSITRNAQLLSSSCPVVVDTHKYYCFAEEDKKLNPWQIIDKVALSEVDTVAGQGAGVIVGEYSCVMDGRSWGNIQGDQRKDLATKFGQKQIARWQKSSGGSFFWTYKMAWMPGGEWGFKEQTTNGALPAGSLASAKESAVRDALARAQGSREALKRASFDQHVNYWNGVAPGQPFEHFRFQDGWDIGFGDALIFFTYRLNNGVKRAGADRIGMLDVWAKRRELEYEESLTMRANGYELDKTYFWEFGHGLRAGIRDFEQAVGFESG